MVIMHYRILLFMVACCVLQPAPDAIAKENVNHPEAGHFLKLHPEDHFMGAKNAKVIIIEYSSVSCPHCAEYKKHTFAQLKADYIDTNKILYIYRDFPINKQGVMGAMLAHCAGPDEYLKYRDILIESQPVWAYRSNYMEVLTSIAKLGGFSDEKIKACFSNVLLQDKIMGKSMDAAVALNIHAAPTFFINGHKHYGVLSYQKMKHIIDSYLQ
jgi:protein-disulfide isomerase